jgi:hypothetical protein
MDNFLDYGFPYIFNDAHYIFPPFISAFITLQLIFVATRRRLHYEWQYSHASGINHATTRNPGLPVLNNVTRKLTNTRSENFYTPINSRQWISIFLTVASQPTADVI